MNIAKELLDKLNNIIEDSGKGNKIVFFKTHVEKLLLLYVNKEDEIKALQSLLEMLPDGIGCAILSSKVDKATELIDLGEKNYD